MDNGGRYASRGFYLQALISIFEIVKDSKWTSMEVEPKEQKIDIILEFEDKGVKAIQVKSTKNHFSKNKAIRLLETIINAQPKATHYEVVLIGECNYDFEEFMKNIDFKKDLNIDPSIDILKKSINVKNIPLDIEALKLEVQLKLREYLSYLGYEIQLYPIEVLNDSLIANSLLSSLSDKKLFKEEFEDNLIRFSEFLCKDKIDDNQIYITNESTSPEVIKQCKHIKRVRKIAATSCIFSIISLISKSIIEGITYLDFIGITVTLILVAGIIFLFKISNSKFEKFEEEEREAYKINTREVQNKICKIKVSHLIEFKNGNKKVRSIIDLFNLTDKSIEYFEAYIHFYQGLRRVYSHPISKGNIYPYDNIKLFEGELSSGKCKYDWSSIRVEIKKLTTSSDIIENQTIFSKSMHKTYSTLLNSYYSPVIYELFGYESTWAVYTIKRPYKEICFLIRNINVKRFFILIFYLLIGFTMGMCVLIGIYNFLYLLIKMIQLFILKLCFYSK